MTDKDITGWWRQEPEINPRHEAARPLRQRLPYEVRSVCHGCMDYLEGIFTEVLEKDLDIRLGSVEFRIVFDDGVGMPLPIPEIIVFNSWDNRRRPHDADPAYYGQQAMMRGLAQALTYERVADCTITRFYPGEEQNPIALDGFDHIALSNLCMELQSKPDALEHFKQNLRLSATAFVDRALQEAYLKDYIDIFAKSLMEAEAPAQVIGTLFVRKNGRTEESKLDAAGVAAAFPEQLERALARQQPEHEVERVRRAIGLPTRATYIEAIESGALMVEAWLEQWKADAGWEDWLGAKEALEAVDQRTTKETERLENEQGYIRQSAGWRKWLSTGLWPQAARQDWEDNARQLRARRAETAALVEEMANLATEMKPLRAMVASCEQFLACVHMVVNADALAVPEAFPLGHIPLREWASHLRQRAGNEDGIPDVTLARNPYLAATKQAMDNRYITALQQLLGAVERLQPHDAEQDAHGRTVLGHLGFLCTEYLDGVKPEMPAFMQEAWALGDAKPKRHVGDAEPGEEKPKRHVTTLAELLEERPDSAVERYTYIDDEELHRGRD